MSVTAMAWPVVLVKVNCFGGTHRRDGAENTSRAVGCRSSAWSAEDTRMSDPWPATMVWLQVLVTATLWLPAMSVTVAPPCASRQTRP